jgi:hypothetical protein
MSTVDNSTEKNLAEYFDLSECTLHLFEVTHSDCLAVEHFADAVLRDDFFFRKGHWLSLLSDSRVRLLVARIQQQGSEEWSEILGVVVLYADSVLHNLFLAKWCRGLGLGSAIIDAVSPTTIRAKVDMSTGDPTGFYNRLGFTHEAARSGKRGQIRILTKLPPSSRANNLKGKKKDGQDDSAVPPRDS